MSAPLLFVREGRTLPFVPVTMQALSAIAGAASARRLAYARSMYLALLEHANEHRDDRAALSRKELGERTGCSPDLISDLAPVLVEARVIKVHERHHAGQRLENEWVIVEPPENRAPLATSHDPLGAQPQRSDVEVKNGVDAPISPTDEIGEVWQHYDATVAKPNRLRRQLGDTEKRIIRTALSVRPKAEVLRAIDGLGRSPHHNGENDRSKKYLELRYALRGNSQKGETPEQRIDMMCEVAAAPTPAAALEPLIKQGDAWKDRI